MVIEIRDGFYDSVKNGVGLADALLKGQRTWSELEGKMDRGRTNSGVVIGETFDALDPNTLCYTKIITSDIKQTTEESTASREEINDPDQPWAGNVRWRESLNIEQILGEDIQNWPKPAVVTSSPKTTL